MTTDEIFNQIRDILISEFEIDPAKVTCEARLFEDLDLDSIDAIDMIVRLQQTTHLKVSAEDFRQIKTLGDVVGVIEHLIEVQHTEASCK